MNFLQVLFAKKYGYSNNHYATLFARAFETARSWLSILVKVGGVEQLLPTNTSVPTTTPLLADIQYPDELRNNQYFNYRTSPTTKNGYATIKSVKGNTLVFNQLINVNVASHYINFDNGVISLIGTPVSQIDLMTNNIEHDSNHKYLLITNTLANPNNVQFTLGMGSGSPWITNVGTIGDHSQLYTNSYRTKLSFYNIANKDLTGIKMTCAIFDLTLMFGSGKEPTSVSDFTNLFPLDYYDYNVGSLLSFNGTGIKTTGKNLLNKDTSNVGKNIASDGSLMNRADTTVSDFIRVLPNTDYYASNFAPLSDARSCYFYDGSKNPLRQKTIYSASSTKGTFKTDTDTFYIRLTYYTTNADVVQLVFGTSELPYEPYEEHTLSLPISTYFPTGMKSAGSVYDELTSTKATTRIGAVDLGNLEYVYDSTVPRFYTSGLANIVKKPSTSDIKGNAISDMYEVLTVNQFFAQTKDKTMMIATNGNISFINTVYNSASAFKSAMSGVYLYYELATPVETEVVTP